MRIEALKILHCAHLVGGHAPNLARAERAAGAQSLAVSWERSLFGYPADEILWSQNSALHAQELARWRLLIRAIGSYNVIHYNYGAPILNWGALDGRHRAMGLGLGAAYASFNQAIELPLLQFAKKVIAVTYQGDDARQGEFSRSHFETCIANEVGEEYYSAETDRAKTLRIARFARHADLIYALNPDILHVLPPHAKFLPYAHINLDEWSPVSRESNDLPLVIHAPSHRGAKGTRFIIEAVKHLQESGIKFRFELVEGLTQSDARNLYEKADLVIDQLLAGWYGGFAVEAMALGKPVICYLRQSDLKFLPNQMRREVPIIEASPDSIESVLRDWVSRPFPALRERGAHGRTYVERWHNPAHIANLVLNDYLAAVSKHE